MAATHAKHHDYHLVNPSPWPLTASISVLFVTIGHVIWMRSMSGGAGLFGAHGPWVFIVGVAGLVTTAFMWWRDVIREAVVEKHHTPIVQLGLRYGMTLFISSEVMFFVAFFWAFFASSLYPVGGVWPPKGIIPFDPFHLPFLNTLILLLSGTTVTWAHHSLIEGDRKGLLQGLGITVLLGMTFTCLQAVEYGDALFKFDGNIFGARIDFVDTTSPA